MEQEFIITSTNNIEGGNVSKYFGVINNNVVVGTNLFSDIGASFLDIFGGTSNSYQNKLKSIYETSIQNLKVKARDLGANAILGLSIDFDEISGGNKSMFMISVSGTAVSVNYTSTKKETDLRINELITNNVLTNELTKNQIIDKVQKEKLLNEEEWYFIQQNPILEISEKLLTNFLKEYGSLSFQVDSPSGNSLMNNVSNYFRILDRDTSINILYNKLIDNTKHIFEILQRNNLFSPEKVLEIFEKGEIGIVVLCLNINKENYSKNDLLIMHNIIESFKKLENRGSIKSTKSLLGKEKEKYICPNGHTNEIESEFCETLNCTQNIKGLTKKQVEQIEYFKIKVETINSLFNKN